MRNIGSSNMTVALGAYCGSDNGPKLITLIWTDAQGQSQRVPYLGPHPPAGCGGAISMRQQDLSPGASFSIAINPQDFRYFSRITKRFETGWKPGGTYLLQAELLNRGESNKLRVHFPAE